MGEAPGDEANALCSVSQSENVVCPRFLQAAGLESRTLPDEATPVTLLTQLEEFARFARTEAQEKMSPSELTRLEHVAHRYPYPPALFRYALALGLNHKYEEAEVELLRLKKLHPIARMDEAREGWATLTKRYPQLSNVVVP
ncbi:Wzy polymerase domain-containing protein [Aromatoleum sp.]|uniref:Wzy polymerase domain-containing protein n=1 Tax=Aromatoleum sp. TaxID=2307007 RepID=UPI002FC8D775